MSFALPPLRKLALPLLLFVVSLAQLVFDIPARHRSFYGGVSTGLGVAMIVSLLGEIEWVKRTVTHDDT